MAENIFVSKDINGAATQLNSVYYYDENGRQNTVNVLQLDKSLVEDAKTDNTVIWRKSLMVWLNFNSVWENGEDYGYVLDRNWLALPYGTKLWVTDEQVVSRTGNKDMDKPYFGRASKRSKILHISYEDIKEECVIKCSPELDTFGAKADGTPLYETQVTGGKPKLKADSIKTPIDDWDKLGYINSIKIGNIDLADYYGPAPKPVEGKAAKPDKYYELTEEITIDIDHRVRPREYSLVAHWYPANFADTGRIEPLPMPSDVREMLRYIDVDSTVSFSTYNRTDDFYVGADNYKQNNTWTLNITYDPHSNRKNIVNKVVPAPTINPYQADGVTVNPKFNTSRYNNSFDTNEITMGNSDEEVSLTTKEVARSYNVLTTLTTVGGLGWASYQVARYYYEAASSTYDSYKYDSHMFGNEATGYSLLNDIAFSENEQYSCTITFTNSLCGLINFDKVNKTSGNVSKELSKIAVMPYKRYNTLHNYLDDANINYQTNIGVHSSEDADRSNDYWINLSQISSGGPIGLRPNYYSDQIPTVLDTIEVRKFDSLNDEFESVSKKSTLTLNLNGDKPNKYNKAWVKCTTRSNWESFATGEIGAKNIKKYPDNNFTGTAADVTAIDSAACYEATFTIGTWDKWPFNSRPGRFAIKLQYSRGTGPNDQNKQEWIHLTNKNMSDRDVSYLETDPALWPLASPFGGTVIWAYVHGYALSTRVISGPTSNYYSYDIKLYFKPTSTLLINSANPLHDLKIVEVAYLPN